MYVQKDFFPITVCESRTYQNYFLPACNHVFFNTELFISIFSSEENKALKKVVYQQVCMKQQILSR